MINFFKYGINKCLPGLGLIVFLGSCANQTNTATEPGHEAAAGTKQSQIDALFLHDAVQIDLFEIQMGQLAQQKSTTEHIQELGKLMENEHIKSQEEVRTLAGVKSIHLPDALSDAGKEDYSRMKARSGRDFDKEYCEMLIQGHNKAIAVFEKAASECTDKDIKMWAMNSLPKLRAHLDHANSCKEKALNSNQ